MSGGTRVGTNEAAGICTHGVDVVSSRAVKKQTKKKKKKKKKRNDEDDQETGVDRIEGPAPLFETVPRPARRGVQARAPTRGGKQTKLYRRKITPR
jgi:hypothetical protein